ncbi:hypothetical protein HJC23_005257 [Cyclotella cryptica]|uniref:Uncharacterized protein n=1 Tax=Cyclotella cryptica TaxID=29204 RepID=A0ABD3PLN6_9STRA
MVVQHFPIVLVRVASLTTGSGKIIVGKCLEIALDYSDPIASIDQLPETHLGLIVHMRDRKMCGFDGRLVIEGRKC